MEHHDFDPGSPRYPGEDTRLTSSKELSGWYSYGWAAEVGIRPIPNIARLTQTAPRSLSFAGSAPSFQSPWSSSLEIEDTYCPIGQNPVQRQPLCLCFQGPLALTIHLLGMTMVNALSASLEPT